VTRYIAREDVPGLLARIAELEAKNRKLHAAGVSALHILLGHVVLLRGDDDQRMCRRVIAELRQAMGYPAEFGDEPPAEHCGRPEGRWRRPSVPDPASHASRRR
jgi:hypothetical protein